MSRTLRTPHPIKATPEYMGERKAHLLNKGAKTWGAIRCGSATVDGEGNHKLNTYDDRRTKDQTASRQIRRAGKVQIKRQMED